MVTFSKYIIQNLMEKDEDDEEENKKEKKMK